MPAPAQREAVKQAALQKVLVLTGGPSLYEARRDRHPQVHCIPSAVDAAHYNPARLRGEDVQPRDRERWQTQRGRGAVEDSEQRRRARVGDARDVQRAPRAGLARIGGHDAGFGAHAGGPQSLGARGPGSRAHFMESHWRSTKFQR